ncbi:MAG: hypothetical protein JNJ58_06365 [Chitinophagaceae bacterium]|nr:hypothetical protein [Chitinophagaceae bacterium]
MKNLLLTAITTLLVFTATVFNACKPDQCKHVSCAYSGTCKDGACICQVGYEGEHCETVTRDKFKGIWNINEDGTLSGAAQYTVSMENGSKINEVIIKNFQNNFTEDVRGVAYRDTLTIPQQSFTNGSTIEGWATIVDTNPLNQHYYQHAVMTVYYKVTNSLGQINEYGSGGAGPSIWSK